MKTNALLALFVMLCSAAIAGTLADSANIFGPRGGEVSDAIAALPVWIETRVQPPAEGLKAYADGRAAAVAEKAFYVVITTQPREWRVSMNPTSLASPEAVRLAGERMVARFRRGEFAPAAISLAHDLTRLPAPTTPAPAAARATDQGKVRHGVQQAPRQQEMPSHVFWVIGCAVGGLLVCWFVVVVVKRLSAATEPSTLSKAPTLTVNPGEAQRLFDSYTPAEREKLIREHRDHHYSSGAAMDPVLFWMMLNAIESSDGPRTSAPAPSSDIDNSWRRSTPPDVTPPTFDSGPSFDSGSSSSDSSGGGGSW